MRFCSIYYILPPFLLPPFTSLILQAQRISSSLHQMKSRRDYPDTCSRELYEKLNTVGLGGGNLLTWISVYSTVATPPSSWRITKTTKLTTTTTMAIRPPSSIVRTIVATRWRDVCSNCIYASVPRVPNPSISVPLLNLTRLSASSLLPRRKNHKQIWSILLLLIKGCCHRRISPIQSWPRQFPRLCLYP